MRLASKIGIATSSLVFAAGALSPSVIFAVTTTQPQTVAPANDDVTTQSDNKGGLQKAAAKKAEVAAKLDATKLKVCEKRETKINNIMGRISDRGQKQLEVFTKISDRTKTFYADKGKTLATYDTLVNDVDAKKTAAQTALDEIKATKADFKCDGTDPKGMGENFKDALKAEQAALKEYKTAVRNLIVGVKSVQSTTTDTTKAKTTESEN